MKKEEKKRGLVIFETNIHSKKKIYDSKRIELIFFCKYSKEEILA